MHTPPRYLALWAPPDVDAWLADLTHSPVVPYGLSGADIVRSPGSLANSSWTVGVSIRVREALRRLLAACPRTAEELVRAKRPVEWDDDDLLLWLTYQENAAYLIEPLRRGALRMRDFHDFAACGAGPLAAMDLCVGHRRRIQRVLTA